MYSLYIYIYDQNMVPFYCYRSLDLPRSGVGVVGGRGGKP